MLRFILVTIVFVVFSLKVQADPTGFAVLHGQQTTNATDSSDLNLSDSSLLWSESFFDETLFSHSTTSSSHEVVIKQFGNYKVSTTIPLTLTNTSSVRRQVIGQIYLNGSPVSHSYMASSYMRQASGHNESSLHEVILLENLTVNDKITVVVAAGAQPGKVTTSGAQLVIEKIDAARSLFTATTTQANSANLNPVSEEDLQWVDSLKSADFTHSNSSATHNITLNTAGTYRAYVNLPYYVTVACSNRVSTRVTIEVDGFQVTGGQASQGYIRCYEDHDSSSVHWSGLIEGVTAGQVLTVKIEGVTNQTYNAEVPVGKQGSIFLEKVDTSSNFISLSGTQLVSGSNWNTTTKSEVQWSTQSINDAAVFSHSTATNSQTITVQQDGDYFLSYTDIMYSIADRSNPITRIKVGGAIVQSGQCKTHYIRDADLHTESSCSLTQYLLGLSAGDTITIENFYESAGGTVDDIYPARLFIEKVNDQTENDTCTSIIDCTPNRIIHFDGMEGASILDDSNRTSTDVSFDTTIARWKDISGSTTVHDAYQTSAVREPSFNPVTMGATFDAVDDRLKIDNHVEINTGTLTEKSFIVVFRTSSDVTTPQVIYEEGGTVRGMNVYIRAGLLYIAFWNLANDGDGSQPFTFASTPIQPDTFYYSSLVIDYSNYSGPTGPDGELRGHINGSAFTSLGTTTSRLFSHPGDNTLGASGDGTYFDTGAQGGGRHYFGGELYEFILYNYAISNTEAVEFYDYLKIKWPDPQPITNLQLPDRYSNLSTTSPLLTWDASVSSGVTHYETAVGETPGGEEEQTWTNQGNVTSVNINGLSLNQCQDYYPAIRAVDGDGDESTAVIGDPFRFDGVIPSDPAGLIVSGSASDTTSKTLNWTSSTDDCELIGYEISVGTSPGDASVYAWTEIPNVTQHQIINGSALFSTGVNYYFNLRAKDGAGNISSVISSSSWQVDTCVASDTTPPTAPSSLTTSGSAGSTSTPQHSWSASTDGCGFSHYELAIGTTSGGTEALSYTNIGDVLTYKYFGISPSLNTNTNYYTSFRAVDLAGNSSSVSTSAAWQLPAPGGVSSGLSLWLDITDAATLFTENTCSSPASSDGDGIGCWTDKSPAGNNAITTASTEPTYELNEFNAQPVLRFNGSNDYLEFSDITNIRTVFIVNKSNSTNHQLLLGDDNIFHFYTDNGTLLNTTYANNNLKNGDWRVDQVDVSSPTTFSQTGGYSLISVVTTGHVEASNIASDRFIAGRYFQGDVAEVIIYDRELSSAEVLAVENYLNSKWFTVIPEPVTSLSTSSDYTTISTESPSFSWTHSTATDLSHYEVAIGSSEGSNDISGWINIGLVNNYQFVGLNLNACTDLYASVRAVDLDGYISSYTSTGVFKYDDLAPSQPVGLNITGTAAATSSPTAIWAASTDTCSATITYEAALVRDSDSAQLVTWTPVASTSQQFLSVAPDLTTGTDYSIHVRAVDEAGNISTEAQSSLWQVESCIASDVVPPTTPTLSSLTGTASVNSTPNMTWTSSSDVCAFSHYEVSLGTSAGAQDLEAWSNIGVINSYQYSGLSPELNFATDYFINVRAVDSAGNFSTVLSTTAFQLNAPGGVSPLGFQLWYDANDTSTLYGNSDCASSPINGNNQQLSCIRDKSGNSNHGTNALNTESPIYQQSSFNGNPALYFDGSVNEFINFNTRLTNIRSVFWVLKEDSSNLGNTAFLLGDSINYDFHREATGGSIFNGTFANANITAGSLQVNSTSVDGTTTTMPSSESVISLITSGNVSAESFSQDRPSCCDGRTWGGYLAELIIFDRALTTTEVSDVENYLKLKWGISSSTTSWTGSVSTDWFNASNWSEGVPSASTSCLITSQTNNPVINGSANCLNVYNTTGQITWQNGAGSELNVYGDFINTGTTTFNDGVLKFVDNGVSATQQTLNSATTIDNIEFSKTAGGNVTIQGSSLTINSFNMPGSSNFEFIIPDGTTLTLNNDLNHNGGTFKIEGGGTLSLANATSVLTTGGTFKVSGTNDTYPQDITSKGTITSSGRWSFLATAGQVELTGFILDNLDVNGLMIDGTANLVTFDGGQFTNLLADFATPVKALNLNSSTTPTETLASNVGFNWGAANATYAGLATPTDSYFLVHANNCNGSTLVFDQWFGDFWGTDPNPETEVKVFDVADGGNCQVSIDIAATPVHLVTLDAIAYNAEVSIEWETGSELNHLGFNVYRSDSIYGNYEQINQEVIQNFVNTTIFKGSYQYIDSGLTNGNTYYYMIEDIALDGSTELHGPVSALPLSSLPVAPTDDSSVNRVDDGNDSPSTHVTQNDFTIINKTYSGMTISIQPPTLTAEVSSWDASHRSIKIPGYSSTLDVGQPELLYRKFLIEVDQAYNNINSAVLLENTTDQSSALTGGEIQPSPSWSLNTSNQLLEPSYSKDTAAYSNNAMAPGQTFNLAAQTTSINGKHFLELEFWPVKYNPTTQGLQQISHLTLNIILDGTAPSHAPVSDGTYDPTPSSIADNLKIEFSSAGVYELSYDDLTTNYLNLPFSDSPLEDLKLFYQGQQLAIEVASVDGLFNSGDVLRFYLPYQSSLDSTFDTAILTTQDLRQLADQDPDLPESYRIEPAVDLADAPIVTGLNYHFKEITLEQDLYAVFDAPLGTNKDHIYWQRIFTEGGQTPGANSTHSVNIDLQDLHTSNDQQVQISIDLRGRGVFNQRPDNHIQLTVNSVVQGAEVFNGQTLVHFMVNATDLLVGSNTIEFTSLATYVNSGDYDLIDINSIKVKYPAEHLAVNNNYEVLAAQPGEQLSISGFTTNNLHIYDVTNPYETLKYNHISPIDVNNDSNYDVFLSPKPGHYGRSGQHLIIIADDQFKTPDQLSLTYGSDEKLLDPNYEVEYLIVAPRAKLGVLEKLRQYRDSDGLVAKAVAIEQVYSEFSYGRKDRNALRKMVQRLITYSGKKLKYLLLVGDSTYDSKGALNSYGVDKMPMPVQSGAQMDFGSDNFYVEGDESISPQIALGRVPTDDENEINDFIDKVISYEQGSTAPTQGKNYNFISGLPTLNETYNNQLVQLSSALTSQNTTLSSNQLTLTDLATAPEQTAAIQQMFEQDALVTTYYGHGSENLWGASGVFTEADASALTNSTLPIVVAMNCLNTHFYDIDPNVKSLGEQFILNKDGGAIAFWGSTSQTAPVAQMNLAQSFFNEMATQTFTSARTKRMGDIILQAKVAQGNSAHSADTVQSWTLFGDPALKLPASSFAYAANSGDDSSSSGGGCGLVSGGAPPTNGSQWPLLVMLLLLPLFVTTKLRI